MMSGYARTENAFAQLRNSIATEGASASLPLGAAGRLKDAILVKDHLGLYHLLTRLPEGRKPFDVPLGRVLKAAWVESDGDGGDGTWLDVTCTDARLLRTFLSLIGEMLDRSDESGRPCIDELSEVLEDWRAAISRARREIARASAIGVFGELVILEKLAISDPMAALSAWKGREGHRHDFARTNALEVKTFSGTGSPTVTIHGLRQLDPPTSGRLHLVAMRIVEEDAGDSLGDLIDRITALGIPRETLARSLGDDAPEIEDRRRRFTLEEVRLHAVGDGFPGIRESALDPSALSGVDSLSYRLNLDACPGSLDPGQLDRILEEL